MEWYYILGIISYSVFIMQAILSLIGSDFDFDIDMDGDIDFDGGDIFSFKGFIHFCLGLTTWLMIFDHFVENVNPFIFYGGAVVFGIFLVYLLSKAYKLCMKLNCIPDNADANGKQGYIYLYLGNDNGIHKYTVNVATGNGTIMVDALSDRKYEIGDTVSIGKTSSGSLYIKE